MEDVSSCVRCRMDGAARRGDQRCKLRLTVEMAMMGGAAAMIGDLNCIWIMSVVDERERERERHLRCRPSYRREELEALLSAAE